MGDLRREQEVFEKVRDQLVRERPNEFVAIRGEEIVGIFPSYNEALRNALDRFGLDGLFLIKRIEERESPPVVSLMWPDALLA